MELWTCLCSVPLGLYIIKSHLHLCVLICCIFFCLFTVAAQTFATIIRGGSVGEKNEKTD